MDKTPTINNNIVKPEENFKAMSNIEKANKKGIKNGFFSFLLVLLLMPIGHAIMILNEKVLHNQKYVGAFIMGFIGIGLIVWGIKKNKKANFATIMGFLGGVLIWTGWVEFSFMWIAEKNNVANLMVNGQIATKREYLVMLSSLGLLGTIMTYFFFTRSNCTFFIWFQNKLGYKNDIAPEGRYFKKPLAITTFIETIMLLWFFYIVLLVVYDDSIAGDKHIATYIVAWGSLIWSIYLISKLITIQVFDYAVRYAVPTVIIFWNFIEVLGRWDTFKEVWIYPIEHWFEVSLMIVLVIGLLFLFLKTPYFKKELRRV
ncbi:MAG TPA: hypothetical protein PLU36_04925 [Chitinophagaceae bacterium]|nr:hypothetical protein [Chitinophagaceae bacterium]HMZ46125.1 hypothetical protein [Chitinophagaceae bacterium]